MHMAALFIGAGVLAVRPPEQGRMLLVPLLSSDIGLPVRIAVAQGAALVAAGPFPGSILVEGDYARLHESFRSNAVLILAAPPAGCGPAATRTRS